MFHDVEFSLLGTPIRIFVKPERNRFYDIGAIINLTELVVAGGRGGESGGRGDGWSKKDFSTPS